MIATIALFTNTVMAIDKGKRSHHQTLWGRIGETRLSCFPVSRYLLTAFYKYSLFTSQAQMISICTDKFYQFGISHRQTEFFKKKDLNF